MMTLAYDKVYLDDVMITLGEFFGYATNKENLEDLGNKFLSSKVAHEFDKGNPRYLNLPSHILFKEVTNQTLENNYLNNFDKTPFYWVGYVLAYFHWHSGLSFEEILSKLSLGKIYEMYNPLHESSLDKFVEVCNKYFFFEETKLAKYRKDANISQSELSKLSDVSLRSIQLYEQRKLDINSAPAYKLLSLSKVLGCEIEDLLEPQPLNK